MAVVEDYAHPHDPAALGGVDVLVVDDDEAVRSSFAEILRLSGYSTAEAEDGMVALELMRRTEVGALVLDMRMPRLDGPGLLDALKHPPPVILVSASSLDGDERGVTANIFWYLQKPIQPQSLLDAVGRALGR